MFVVMTVGASEAEILGVKSQILAEGLTPFDHVIGGRTTVAVVGEIGARRPALLERFATMPGVDQHLPGAIPEFALRHQRHRRLHARNRTV